MVFQSAEGAEEAAGAGEAGEAGAAAGAGVEGVAGGGVGVLLSLGAESGLSQPARQMAAIRAKESFMLIFFGMVVQNA